MKPLNDRQPVRAVLVALFLVLGVGCDDGEAPAQPATSTSADLLAAGSYGVGYRQAELTYDRTASDEQRTLPLQIWYPTSPDPTAARADYRVSGIVTVPSDAAIADAAVAEGGPFPVVVYSHGSGGEALLAYPYGELFASHGFVVISANHVGNTAIDAVAGSADPFGRIALDRPADIRAMLDWLEGLDAADPLAGRVQADNAMLIGHSFGGYTTYAAGGAAIDLTSLSDGCAPDSCAVYDDPAASAAFNDGFGDPRFKALVPQAPALIGAFADGTLASLGKPVMLQTGRLDATTTQANSAEPAWNRGTGTDDLWIEMPTGAHYSFISICYDLEPDLLAAFRPNASEDGCGPQFIDAQEAVETLAGYALGFARQHLLGETQWDAVLRGPVFHPEFELTTR